MLEEYSDVLVIEDIMQILKIGKNSAYNLVNSGAISSLRIGRNIRIPKLFMMDYLGNKYYTDNNNMLCAPMSNERSIVK